MTDRTATHAPVPLLDLGRQYRPLRDDLLAALTRVSDSQRFILGAEVEALLGVRGERAKLVASAGRFSLFQLRSSTSERGSLARGTPIGTRAP